MPVPGRALILLALLLAPLATAELWARRSIDALFPYLKEADTWSDTKSLLLARAGCPDVLAIGSSMTNRTIVEELVQGETLPFPGETREVGPVFTFGLEGQRAALMYAIWRHVERTGCVPPYVFVEANPIVLNGSPGPRGLWAPFLPPPTFARLPGGFSREMSLGARDLIEHWTWKRLLVFRQRAPIAQALFERARYDGDDAPEGLPLHGVLKPLMERSLQGQHFVREAAERRALDLPYVPSPVQAASLRKLVAEAAQAGSRVVVHTPPVTVLYRNKIVELGGQPAWCDFVERFGSEPDVEWFNAYGGLGFKQRNFGDWVHLNRLGGRHYVSLLFRAIRARSYPDAEGCA